MYNYCQLFFGQRFVVFDKGYELCIITSLFFFRECKLDTWLPFKFVYYLRVFLLLDIFYVSL